MKASGIPGTFGAFFVLFVLSFCLPIEAAVAGDTAARPDEQARQAELEEIVVVAHKHARSRRDVAATVSVFSFPVSTETWSA